LVVASTGGTAPGLYHNRGDGTFELDRRSAPLAARTLAARTALFVDFDNDGFLDLIVGGTPTKAGGRSLFLFRNDQTGRFVDYSSILPTGLDPARRVVAVDYDHDGDLDLIVVGSDGRPRLLLNEGGNANQYVQVQLAALRTGSGKNNAFGIGSTLELRAGKLYESRVVTGPAPQNGPRGRYVLQLTEELWETAYLDQAKLLVVDHPDSVDVYVDEGFVPPAPGPGALRLYRVSHPRPPVSATDEHGTDWLAAL